MANLEIKWIKAKDQNGDNADWISQIAELNGDLPSKCLFQKVLTGAGGTTVALNNDKPYVIAMPFKNGIDNKLVWANENNKPVVGVHSDLFPTDREIINANKIVVTFDSLPKVTSLLEKSGRIGEFKLLIDEYHILTKAGDFRNDAVREVLREFQKYSEWVFMTATPIHRSYLPLSLSTLPEVRIKWNNLQPVNLEKTVIDGGKLWSTTAGVAYRHFTGEYKGNAYFFLNSVSGIVEVIQHLKKVGITPADVKIVCANTENNVERFRRGSCARFKIEGAQSLVAFPKKINFITSTCFESADILDVDGLTYIVTDGKLEHTKYDIVTTIPQIIGRIRNSRYKNFARLLISPNTHFSYSSKEEFEAETMRQLADAQRRIEMWNTIFTEEDKNFYKVSYQSSPYVILNDNGVAELDEMAYKARMSDFEAIHHTYNIRRDVNGDVITEGLEDSFKVGEIDYFSRFNDQDYTLNRLEAKEMGLAKPNFKDYCELYNQIYYDGPNGLLGMNIKVLTTDQETKIRYIESEYPFIRQAFSTLGYAKIKALEFRIVDIKAELIREVNLSQPFKVRQLINKSKYRIGANIPKEEIKKDLQELFDKLHFEKPAKAEDIKRLFVVKPGKAKRNNQWVHSFKLIAIAA